MFCGPIYSLPFHYNKYIQFMKFFSIFSKLIKKKSSSRALRKILSVHNYTSISYGKIVGVLFAINTLVIYTMKKNAIKFMESIRWNQSFFEFKYWSFNLEQMNIWENFQYFSRVYEKQTFIYNLHIKQFYRVVILFGSINLYKNMFKLSRTISQYIEMEGIVLLACALEP